MNTTSINEVIESLKKNADTLSQATAAAIADAAKEAAKPVRARRREGVDMSRLLRVDDFMRQKMAPEGYIKAMQMALKDLAILAYRGRRGGRDPKYAPGSTLFPSFTEKERSVLNVAWRALQATQPVRAWERAQKDSGKVLTEKESSS